MKELQQKELSAILIGDFNSQKKILGYTSFENLQEMVATVLPNLTVELPLGTASNSMKPTRTDRFYLRIKKQYNGKKFRTITDFYDFKYPSQTIYQLLQNRTKINDQNYYYENENCNKCFHYLHLA